MYPEGISTISIKDQVKSDFLALVDFLSTRLSFPWWFAVKEDARNRHSLAGAIGITRDELLSVLEIFGVCRKRGKIINVRNDVVLWAQTNGLKTYFNSESNINLSRSKCTLSNKLQLFLRLGAPIDSDCVSIPSLQRLVDMSGIQVTTKIHFIAALHNYYLSVIQRTELSDFRSSPDIIKLY